MSNKRVISFFFYFFLISLFLVIPSSVVHSEPQADWSSWSQNLQAYVQNNAGVELPSGYTVSLILDTADLISSGHMRSDCADLRISYDHLGVDTELDRLVEYCDTSDTTIRFRTQAAIPASSVDIEYLLHYGNSLAGPAPENPTNVYAFYDDFQDGDASGWNGIDGTWSVVDESGNYFYRYTGGGTGWAISYVNLTDVSNLDYLAKIRATGPVTNWIGLAFRIQDQSNFLTIYESKDVNQFKYARIIGDNHNILQFPAFTMDYSLWYWVRLQAHGSSLRGRIWQEGTAEPGSWLINYTDTTYQTETNIGATLYNHTTNADWDDVQVRKLVEPEPSVQIQWDSQEWWDNTWVYRRQLTIDNTSTVNPLVADYSISFTLDTQSLIAAGQMLSDCSDLRVVAAIGPTPTEIDRVVENCDNSQTKVWFALQRPVPASSQDSSYYMYYGNPSAGAPLADGMNVFLFFEDWEQGTSHWTNAGGLDPANTGTMGTSLISNEQAVSPLNSQKFPQKAGGGDAFSGYIPVTSSTSYQIGVWGQSATAAYAPVGFDPYTSSYVIGSEVWLWTNEWSLSPTWVHRSATFTTSSTTAYIKIKSEWWDQGPGTEPVYLDNLYLGYGIDSPPIMTLGDEETILPAPTITNISNNGPVELGNAVIVSAVVSTTEGTIDTVTLRVASPELLDVPMGLISGDNTDGTWQGGLTPGQGGTYSYRIFAEASTGLSKLSEEHTFDVTDSQPPQVSLVSVIDPIQVHDTQTLVVEVTDNGQVDLVRVTVEGTTEDMTQSGDEYSYSWDVATVGTIDYTVVATDTVGNPSTFNSSFESQARAVDVCTWKDCKSGAASFSMDDGNSGCRAELEAAGIRGTYFYNGSSTQSWFSTYSAAGHEIASHTVGHPCNVPCCTPNCTPETLAACPYTQTDVDNYRQNQLDGNIQAIEAGTGLPVNVLAWPCGCTDPGRMEAASFYFLGARGYYDYIAQLTWLQDVNEPTPVNFMNLNTANSYDQTFIDRAINEGKWATITSHGSCAGIDYMGSRQDVLWVGTFGEVLKYIKVRDAAQFSNYSQVDREISFDAVHNLGTFSRQTLAGAPLLPIVFNNPVTLKVHIQNSDDVLSVEVDGAPVSFNVLDIEGTRYVIFDASLEVSRHVVVTLALPAPVIGTITDNSPIELGEQAVVNAEVTVPQGSLGDVTLHLDSPISADYPMSRIGVTDVFSTSFTTTQTGPQTYRILASNTEGTSSQSDLQTLEIVDTTAPSWRNLSPVAESVEPGGIIQLSGEGMDLGGLDWAILMTDESGGWQEFDYPVNDWWNYAWPHRRSVTINESAGLDRTNALLDLQISETQFPGLTSCADELRVADTNRVEIPRQVYNEHLDGGILTCQLLFQVNVGATSSSTYYVYYGNPAAAPPSYVTDLTSSYSGGLTTVSNSYFNLDLDEDGGVISRLRLPLGSDTNLPLSVESNSYWGWHQVCSSLDGNISGKDNLCQGGTTPASGLTFSNTLDGPIVKEFVFSSVKGAATYTMGFRFMANSPYYQYTLSSEGTTATVMNNFWYTNGNFASLGAGTGGTPVTFYNTYSSGTNHVRIASFESVDYASIDGTNNDGTDLGGTDYRYPSATSLNLWVATGADQAATEQVLARVDAPVSSVWGAIEDAPTGQYGSPIFLDGAAGWNATAFDWQNHTIPACNAVQWRIKYCDQEGNCGMTDIQFFNVMTPMVPAPLEYYIDSAWAGTTLCTDPDGTGPATSYGHDSFSEIQWGITTAQIGAAVSVAPGIYSGTVDLNVDVSLTLEGDTTLSGDLTIQDGTFIAPSTNLTLTGDFSRTNPGEFQHNSGTVILGGTNGAQNIGGGALTQFQNLNINNPYGVYLHQDQQIRGILSLISGRYHLGSSNLTMTATASFGNNPIDNSNMIVADGSGVLCKLLNSDNPFTYPIGDDSDGTADYSPVTVELPNQTSPEPPWPLICVNLTDLKHPDMSDAHYLSRYWSITQSNSFDPPATLLFNYVEADVVGTESVILGGKYDAGVGWTYGDPVDTGTNTFTLNVDSFSDFSGGSSPTAVTMGRFTAEPQNGSISVNWETLMEVDLLGFNIYRSVSPNEPMEKINSQIIPATLGGIGGSLYEWIDQTAQPGVIYYYWLEVVDLFGNRQIYGPVNAAWFFQKFFPAIFSH